MIDIITCNDDWATDRSDVRYLLTTYHPMCMATQESKGENYAQQVPGEYGVYQVMHDAGTRGVAVCWDKTRAHAIPGTGHRGWQFLADNKGLEQRGVVWQDLMTNDGLRFTLASSHRPPKRYDDLWDTYDHNLVEWFNKRGLPVLLGMDSNEKGGPGKPLTNHAKWYGSGVDGILTELAGSWRVKVLPERSSDHHALLISSGTPPARVGSTPSFTHIHCSSRWDRPAAKLEQDLDDWMQQCSIVTLTEIATDSRAAQLQEQGWNYYNSPDPHGLDECGIGWKLDTWHRGKAVARKLNNDVYYRLDGRVADPVASASVLLKHVKSGHKLLVSVTHMPAHVEGRGGWRTTENKWQARKNAYLSSLKNWSTHIKDLRTQWKPDAALIIADWNLNLKQRWVQELMKDHWGTAYKRCWVHFPTSGGSLGGGPVAPNGSPGQGHGDRIIDGTYRWGAIKVSTEPILMARVSSSDHRPYKEGFTFTTGAGTPVTSTPGDDTATGDNYWGPAWWGFGDYMDDELYEDTFAEVGTGEAGGEVL